MSFITGPASKAAANSSASRSKRPNAAYVDVAREPESKGQGTAAMLRILESTREPHIPFAPPFLKDGDLIIPHVANILLYLGPKLGLAPEDEKLRYVLNGLQLTVTDFVAEVHDTHHPISGGLYYEDQKTEAKARARRLPAPSTAEVHVLFRARAAAKSLRQSSRRG